MIFSSIILFFLLHYSFRPGSGRNSDFSVEAMHLYLNIHLSLNFI
ncbi:hypothetical protein HMPREF1589_05672 [Escherichia coli 113290]|nr:hypothetical protein HMPREF1589_05672 [Escherichia coli 113290]